MKIGKIRGNAYQRAIIKEFHNRREDVCFYPGADAARVSLGDEQQMICATETMIDTFEGAEKLALHRACNNLYAAGGTPRAVQMAITLPQDYEEAAFRRMMRRIDAFCETNQLQLAGGHTEVADAVNAPIVTALAVGAVKNGEYLSPKQMEAGMELVLAGPIAKEGTLVVLTRLEEKLKSHFTGAFLDEARQKVEDLSIAKIAQYAKKHGARAMHDLAGGGVFGALWEMADSAGVGLEVDLKAIVIEQQSVEVCEYAGLNPYELASSGSVLIATWDGALLVQALMDAGIKATLIGRTTDGNDRILRNGEEVRYLDLPKADELYKLDTCD
ncbi:AIR synthase-related protein [Eubacterium oxidoreducens]|nr:AIR synthase-related protein [Eubacterium oxidoreducens]